MKPIKIVTDSAADLTREQLDQNNIDVAYFSVTFDKEHSLIEGKDISTDEFYDILSNEDVFPLTSLPPVHDYIEIFRANILAGYDILCITLTSNFSGSYQSALNAAEIVKDEFPEANITVMDSKLATLAEGMQVLQACKMRDEGHGIAYIVDKCRKIENKCQIFLVVDTFTYLQKGGRIGKGVALAGGLLNIKPIMTLKNGELEPVAAVRGRKKAMKDIVSRLKRDMTGKPDDYEFLAVHSQSPDMAELVAMMAEAGMGLTLAPGNLGVTIGAHTGPKMFAAAFMHKYTAV